MMALMAVLAVSPRLLAVSPRLHPRPRQPRIAHGGQNRASLMAVMQEPARSLSSDFLCGADIFDAARPALLAENTYGDAEERRRRPSAQTEVPSRRRPPPAPLETSGVSLSPLDMSSERFRSGPRDAEASRGRGWAVRRRASPSASTGTVRSAPAAVERPLTLPRDEPRPTEPRAKPVSFDVMLSGAGIHEAARPALHRGGRWQGIGASADDANADSRRQRRSQSSPSVQEAPVQQSEPEDIRFRLEAAAAEKAAAAEAAAAAALCNLTSPPGPSHAGSPLSNIVNAYQGRLSAEEEAPFRNMLETHPSRGPTERPPHDVRLTCSKGVWALHETRRRVPSVRHGRALSETSHRRRSAWRTERQRDSRTAARARAWVRP